jgi:hypothetical protein
MGLRTKGLLLAESALTPQTGVGACGGHGLPCSCSYAGLSVASICGLSPARSTFPFSRVAATIPVWMQTPLPSRCRRMAKSWSQGRSPKSAGPPGTGSRVCIRTDRMTRVSIPGPGPAAWSSRWCCFPMADWYWRDALPCLTARPGPMWHGCCQTAPWIQRFGRCQTISR